jgi:hypothetical protein
MRHFEVHKRASNDQTFRADPDHRRQGAARNERPSMSRRFTVSKSMFWKSLGALVITSSVLAAAPAAAKRHHVRPWHGYGFLPGYRSPERIEWERARERGPVYWYGYPGFYRGRWNGGGFGPCWTQTPIGNVWNCGR